MKGRIRPCLLAAVMLLAFMLSGCAALQELELPPLPDFEAVGSPAPTSASTTAPVASQEPTKEQDKPALQEALPAPAKQAEPTPPVQTEPTPVAQIEPAQATNEPVETPAALETGEAAATASNEPARAEAVIAAPAAPNYTTPTLNISGVTLPPDMEMRNVSILRGSITTDCGYITYVYGVLYDSTGAVAQDCDFYPYQETVSLAGTVNTQLRFAYLEPDTYTYQVSARADNGSAHAQSVLIDHSFTVTKPVSTPPPATNGTYEAVYVQGGDNASLIWNYFIAQLNNPYGAAGILGNIRTESVCCPTRIEGDVSSDCAYSNLYTAGVDDGSVTREAFVSFAPDDGYGLGYGLCQWGSGRKGALYDLAKERGVSVGDLTLQCDFIMKELNEDYPSLLEYLKTSTDAEEAAAEFCRVFERAQVHGGRTTFAAEYLAQFAS